MAGYGKELCDRTGSAWTRFWFTPSDPIVLSLIRLLTGLLAIWWYLGFYADLHLWFGNNGLFDAAGTAQWRGDEMGNSSFAITLLDYVQTPSQLWIAYGVGLVVLVLMAAGVLARITTIAALVVVLSFIHRTPMLARPVDDILPMLMFYLCIGPSGADFSFDAWLRRRRAAAAEKDATLPSRPASRLSSWATVAVRLMQVHVALIYAAMAIAQLQGDDWWQGTAVWWLMARPESRLVDVTGLHSMGQAFEYLVNFLTHAIVLYELGFALLIWHDLARPILLVLGLFVWIGIAVIGGAPSFAAAMLIGNLAFLSPQTLRGWRGAGGATSIAAADYV